MVTRQLQFKVELNILKRRALPRVVYSSRTTTLLLVI